MDYRDILLIDVLREWRTVNASYQRLDEVKLNYRRKRRDMSTRSAILLHDNARPRKLALTRDILDKIHGKTLRHPPYIPDL